ITYAPLKDDPKRMAIHGNGVYPLPTIICDPGDLMRIRIINNIVSTTKRSNKRKRDYISNNNFTDLDVISKDNIDAFTIHFHGILQHNYNFAVNETGKTIINGLADGVPFITQLPTLPGQNYLYEFSIDAKQAGTFFYHSHWALSAITGHGAFIVRDTTPPTDYGAFEEFPYGVTDEPFILMLSDLWTNSDQVLLKGVTDPNNFTAVGDPSEILIDDNLKGDSVFQVEASKTYRIRVIGATSVETIVLVQLINLIIPNYSFLPNKEVEGSFVKPVVVDSLEVAPGQRYSVLVTADQPPGDYNIYGEIRLREELPTSGKNATAILRYVNSATPPSGIPVLPEQSPPITFEMLADVEPIPTKAADRTIVLVQRQNATITAKGGRIVRININGVVFEDFSTPILLDLITGIRPKVIDYNALDVNGYDATRKSYPLKKNEVIDLVFQSTISSAGGCEYHPWHLHGHKFWEITHGPGLYPNGLDKTKIAKLPVTRDTTTVYADPPSETAKEGDGCGWRLVRFVADNPGAWIVHCHIAPHMLMGMMAVFEEAVEELPSFTTSALISYLDEKNNPS
ncbi:12762_t:CDS:2, partial [Entrophospora sp. SA101]